MSNNNNSLKYFFLLILGSLFLRLNNECEAASNNRLNVLLLISDDLGLQQLDMVRTELSEYNTWLNENTVEFRRIKADTPVCGPSRASLLTGRTNDRLGGVTFDTNFIVTLMNNNASTIFGAFAQQGYQTTSIGKVEHDTSHNAMVYSQQYTIAGNTYNNNPNNECGQMKIGCVVNTKTLDDQITNNCIKQIKRFAQEYKQSAKNFFLGCGFYDPHYPYRTTSTNYQSCSSEISPQDVKKKFTESDLKSLQQTGVILPIQVPQLDGVTWELNGHNFDASKVLSNIKFPYNSNGKTIYTKLAQIPNDFMNDNINYSMLNKLRCGAIKTLQDLQYKVIKAVYSAGIQNNTIIVITSDHGKGSGSMKYDQNLNEYKGSWAKNSLFPDVSYIPAFFYVPGITNNGRKNKISLVPATNVNIATTIHQLVFNKPMPQGKLTVDGIDLTPWIKNPNADYSNIYSINQYPRGPLGQSQIDPLMNSKETGGGNCNPNLPESGRKPWRNMSYAIEMSSNRISYTLLVIFPFCETSACINPKLPNEKPADKIFEDGKPSWQIVNGCIDTSKPQQLMLFSNNTADMGANLLINGGSKTNQNIAKKMLNTIITDRSYKKCSKEFAQLSCRI